MEMLPLFWVLKTPVPVQFIYFALSIVIAFAGINRKMGLWGYLFSSVIFSPLIGMMLVLVSDKKKEKKES
jgi:hypothetical protein